LAAADPGSALKKGVIPDLRAERIGELEAWIDELEGSLPPLDAFLLPGGSPVGAQLQVARTVCRRAERAISSLLEVQPELGEVVLPYMNRLSDLLFVLARASNREAGVEDPEWRPRSDGDPREGDA
jgi:cob(I)alamin adenosyltransferase